MPSRRVRRAQADHGGPEDIDALGRPARRLAGGGVRHAAAHRLGIPLRGPAPALPVVGGARAPLRVGVAAHRRGHHRPHLTGHRHPRPGRHGALRRRRAAPEDRGPRVHPGRGPRHGPPHEAARHDVGPGHLHGHLHGGARPLRRVGERPVGTRSPCTPPVRGSCTCWVRPRAWRPTTPWPAAPRPPTAEQTPRPGTPSGRCTGTPTRTGRPRHRTPGAARRGRTRRRAAVGVRRCWGGASHSAFSTRSSPPSPRPPPW